MEQEKKSNGEFFGIIVIIIILIIGGIYILHSEYKNYINRKQPPTTQNSNLK
jgi:uncharacterized protein YneF (UPF0154 family)